MTLHKQWARPFVGCFAFLGFKLPLNVKSIWLSLEQLYMCKCIWVWLPLFFPLFFFSFLFLLFSWRWCNFSLIHANTCFFKREKEEREEWEKLLSVLFFITISTNTRLPHYGSSLPRTKRKGLVAMILYIMGAQIKSGCYVNLGSWCLGRRLSR